MHNQRIALGVGALVLLSVVVAGIVIFSDTPQRAVRRTETPSAAVSGGALVMGPARARHRVEVREDFGSGQSRAFDVASRDFLRIEAARGDVRVTYRPESSERGEYAAQALATYQDALTGDSAHEVLVLRSELYDRQPSTITAGGVGATPVVTLDGSAVKGNDGTGLADALQEQLTR